MSNNFRDLIPPPDHPRIAGISERDAYSHAANAMATRPRVQSCWRNGARGSSEPFRGITTDGDVVPDLYSLTDESAPTGAMVAAARTVLNVATAEERARLCHAIDAPQWRMWSNPELYFDRFGLRLDELGAAAARCDFGGDAGQPESRRATPRRAAPCAPTPSLASWSTRRAS